MNLPTVGRSGAGRRGDLERDRMESEGMRRGLVLGGGGPVGIAGESGLAKGLGEGGVDLRTADRIVGTSAGSVVGTRLAAGQDLATLDGSPRRGTSGGPSLADLGAGGVPDLATLQQVFVTWLAPGEMTQERG